MHNIFSLVDRTDAPFSAVLEAAHMTAVSIASDYGLGAVWSVHHRGQIELADGWSSYMFEITTAGGGDPHLAMYPPLDSGLWVGGCV